MPFRLGALAYPAFAAALYLGRPNAVAEFERAGAYTPQTSRRPESLKVKRKLVNKAVKRGLLVPTGDGRYYINREGVRRSDRKKVLLWVFVLLTFLPLLWLMW